MAENWKSGNRDSNVDANRQRQRDTLHVPVSKTTRDEVKRINDSVKKEVKNAQAGR